MKNVGEFCLDARHQTQWVPVLIFNQRIWIAVLVVYNEFNSLIKLFSTESHKKARTHWSNIGVSDAIGWCTNHLIGNVHQ